MTVPTGIYLLIQNIWLTQYQPCLVGYIYQTTESAEKPAGFLKNCLVYKKYLMYIALMPVVKKMHPVNSILFF